MTVLRKANANWFVTCRKIKKINNVNKKRFKEEKTDSGFNSSQAS